MKMNEPPSRTRGASGLHGEVVAFGVDGEGAVVKILGDVFGRRQRGEAGVDDDEVDLAKLPLDAVGEGVDVREAGGVGFERVGVGAELAGDGIELALVAAGEEDLRAAVDESANDAEADAGVFRR